MIGTRIFWVDFTTKTIIILACLFEAQSFNCTTSFGYIRIRRCRCIAEECFHWVSSIKAEINFFKKLLLKKINKILQKINMHSVQSGFNNIVYFDFLTIFLGWRDNSFRVSVKYSYFPYIKTRAKRNVTREGNFHGDLF